MPKLNLASDDFYMTKVIEFLKQNVTEALADKINNGVFIEKDGKRLLNKKDINGFDKYTYTQAEKLVSEKKGLQRVRVTNSDVYEWAIKYFDDDTVEGTLFNEDGSEYKPPKPVAAAKPTTTYTPPAPKPKPQMSLFELIEEQKPENAPNVPEQKTEEVTNDTPPDEELSAEEQREILEEIAANDIESPAVQPQGSPFYQRYMQIQNKYPDHIVAFKRGEFYEILGKNAELFAKELSLPLSERDCGFLERVPMVGVPFHAVDNYIAKAVQKGLKIAVADSLGEVKELPKPAAEQSKGSSIYQQYMNAQSKYPDYIVAYRLGDFYEIFGEKAKQFACELDLTLTGRDCGLPERVPMVGFPCHAANTYFVKAVNKGLKVAVFDSPGDNSIELYEPKQALPTEPEKHWIDEKTYIDDDGIVHDIETETEETAPAFDMSAFDTEALAKLDELFGEIIDLR